MHKVLNDENISYFKETTLNKNNFNLILSHSLAIIAFKHLKYH